jgi:hypothetical protein
MVKGLIYQITMGWVVIWCDTEYDIMMLLNVSMYLLWNVGLNYENALDFKIG